MHAIPADLDGVILIAPHQFPSVEREEELAKEFGLDLVVAADGDEFHRLVPSAAVILLTPYAKVTAEDFEAMTRCRAVIRYGMGYDNVDLAGARKAGVPVAIVPGTATEEVASHALSLGLSLARRIPEGQRSIQNHGWARSIGFDTPKLTSLEVGVLGMGRIGAQVARWYAALGATVRGYDPFISFSDVPSATVDEIIEHSHIVSLHVPLNDDTKHLISREVIARMRHRAVVVNVSRGGLIDEQALAEALESGHLAGAGIDTFTTEPLPEDHVLRNAPNAILTPHVAWRSDSSLAALQAGAVEQAASALRGTPLADVVS